MKTEKKTHRGPKKVSEAELEFAADCRAALLSTRMPKTYAVIYITIAFLVAFLFWASFTKLDEVAKCEGKIVPTTSVHVVQNLEGGIIEEIHVREGDIVNKDQILLKLNDIMLAASNNETKARRDSLVKTIDLMNKEIAITEPLETQGVVSKVEILRLQRQLFEMTGELERLNEALYGSDDRVARAIIRAPTYGAVSRLAFKTVGAVVRPGEIIMEVVPLDDSLLIEAKIRPTDIGFIHLGQKATVKITAYDFSIYGGLEGEVENISPNTITTDKGESFYVAWIRTQKSTLDRDGQSHPLIPGMQTEVDILTGHRTVLQYLLKPILRAKESAFRER